MRRQDGQHALRTALEVMARFGPQCVHNYEITYILIQKSLDAIPVASFVPAFHARHTENSEKCAMVDAMQY